ncbi:MFS transporter [Sphingosinicella sp. YJ22]|uniref:MFS transporter n=1 Tax=Sphingosinicella sp. YJ22 TaxID=1104780 RepID=UPI00140BA738|nr:MFS transporter [Sphingosinicella sp. YJ22]
MSAAIPAPCDSARAATVRSRPCPSPRLTLAASILASSLAFVDGSVVNVALPAIGADLGGGASGLQWIVNAYLLPLSALLLLGGALGDRYGRRRMFLVGVALFGTASILCFLAPSLPLLLAGRACQGIAAAMLLPNSLALLGAAFEGEKRGQAIGTWAAAGAIAGAVGPLLGGWLVETVGWRAIFLINLPLSLGALWLGWRHVTESSSDNEAPLDWAGVAAATVGLGAITWGLTILSGEADGAATQGWIATVGGAAALMLFLVIEKRRRDRAIMPLAMFGTASFVGLSILTFFLYAALGALFVVLPYLLIELHGYAPVEAGAALLPLPIVLGLGSRFMGGLAARIGPRLPLTIGPVVVAVGFALLSRAGSDPSYWTGVAPGLFLMAIGMAGAVAPLTTAVMASVDESHVGTANGFNSAIARTGGLIATALLGSVLAARGEGLAEAFAMAAWVMVGAAVVSALAALLLLRPREIET